MAENLGSVVIEIGGNTAPFEAAVARAKAAAANIGGVKIPGLDASKFKQATKELETSGGKLKEIFRDAANSIAVMQGPLGPIAGRLNFIGSAFGRMGIAVGGTTLALGGLTFAAQKAVRAFAEEEEQLLTINAVLKSTGYAAGQTADQLADLADAVSKSTLATDDQVRSAETLLLTFRSVRGQEFPATIKAAQDLAAAGFGSITSSVMQLGKAMEDPIRGISALRRAGVSFTESQKDMIRTWQESGQVARIHAEILKTVKEQVGGAGEAGAGGITGAYHRFSESLNDASVALGKFISQGINLPGWLDGMTSAFNLLSNNVGSFTDKLDYMTIKWAYWTRQITKEEAVAAINKLNEAIDATTKAADHGQRALEEHAAAVASDAKAAETARQMYDGVRIALEREGKDARLSALEQEILTKQRDAGVVGNKALEASIRKLVVAKAQEADVDNRRQRQIDRDVDLRIAQKELELVGKSVQEQNRLRDAYSETERRKADAAKIGITADAAEISRIEAKAAAMAKVNQQVEELQKSLELQTQRQTMFLSDAEQTVAATMQQWFPSDWQNHMNDTIARQARFNERLKTSYDLSRDFAGTFVDGVMEGKSAVDSLTDALKNLEKKLLDMALDAVIKGLFSALSGGGGSGGGILGALMGGGGLGGGTTARQPGLFHTGGRVGSTAVPTYTGGKLAYNEYPAILHAGESVIPSSGRLPSMSGQQMLGMFGGVPKFEGGFNAAAAAAGAYTAGDTGAHGTWSSVSGGGGNAALTAGLASQYASSQAYGTGSFSGAGRSRDTGGGISTRVVSAGRGGRVVTSVPDVAAPRLRMPARPEFIIGGATIPKKDDWSYLDKEIAALPDINPIPLLPGTVLKGATSVKTKTVYVGTPGWSESQKPYTGGMPARTSIVTLPQPRPSWAPQGAPVPGHYSRPPTGPDLMKPAVEYPAGQQQYGPIFQPTRAERAFSNVTAGASITDRAVGYGAFPWARTPIDYGSGTFAGGHGIYGTGSMAGSYGLSVGAAGRAGVFPNYGAGSFIGGHGEMPTTMPSFMATAARSIREAGSRGSSPFNVGGGIMPGAGSIASGFSRPSVFSDYGSGTFRGGYGTIPLPGGVGWPGAGSAAFRTAARSADDGVSRNVIADLTRRGLTGTTAAAPLVSDLLGRTGYPGPYGTAGRTASDVAAGRTATDARLAGTEINSGAAGPWSALQKNLTYGRSVPGGPVPFATFAGAGIPPSHQWSGAQGYAVPRTSYTPYTHEIRPWNPANDPASGYGLGAGVPQWDYPDLTGAPVYGPYIPSIVLGDTLPGLVSKTPFHGVTATAALRGETGLQWSQLQGPRLNQATSGVGGAWNKLFGGYRTDWDKPPPGAPGAGAPIVDSPDTALARSVRDLAMARRQTLETIKDIGARPPIGGRVTSSASALQAVAFARMGGLPGASGTMPRGAVPVPVTRPGGGGIDPNAEQGAPAVVPGGAADLGPGMLSLAGFLTDGSHPNLKLADPIMQDSLARGIRHMPGYTLEVTEGYVPRPANWRPHMGYHAQNSQHYVAGHAAVDMYIRGPDGQRIPRTGSWPPSKADREGPYGQLDHWARVEMAARFPGRHLTWGGNFETSKGSRRSDLMHWDMRGSAGRSVSRRSGGGRSGGGRGGVTRGIGDSAFERSSTDLLNYLQEGSAFGGSRARENPGVGAGLTFPQEILNSLYQDDDSGVIRVGVIPPMPVAGPISSWNDLVDRNATSDNNPTVRAVPMYGTGGVVGSTPVPHRIVPSKIFFNAPRFQGGTGDVGPGEYPAILHSGETVTPAGGRSRASQPIIINTPAAPPPVVTVNVTNNSNASVSTSSQETDNGMRLDIMIDEIVSSKMRDGGSKTAKTLGSLGARPSPIRR